MPDNSDQVVAVIARLSRGRVDRPFRVTKDTLIAKTGLAESIRVNALNEAKLQLYEALNNGAYAGVVQRLVASDYVKSYAIINFSGSPSSSATTVAFSTAPQAPTAGFSMYLMDHECHNDGIKLSLHADATPLGGTAVANALLTLRVMDAQGNVRYEFYGSLDQTAKDDYGNSIYLPDVVSTITQGAIELVVATGATVPAASNAYGRTNGKDNWAVSSTLVCFTEGSSTYVTDDFDRCISGLRNTMLPFGYLMTGGSQSTSLVSKLGALAVEINRPLKVDVPGNLTKDAAIAWMLGMSFDAMLVHVNWNPVEAEDPMNGGRVVWGTGGLQAGYSCARNARVNADGFAPKNYPVSGAAWKVNRVNPRSLVTFEEIDLSDLAQAKINTVKFETYSSGSGYVWIDCLTSAKTQVSVRSLQSVAEMSATMDEWVALAAKEWTQLPMLEFIDNMTRFLEKLLPGAQTAKWLKPAKNLPGNAAYAFTVKPSTVRPNDTVHVEYWASYDGVARRVIIQQTLIN